MDLNLLKRVTEDTQTYPDVYLGKFNGVSDFALGNLIAVVGQAKSCKSTFLKIVTASLIGHNKSFGIDPLVDLSSVTYFDTEQSLHDTKGWYLETTKLGANKEKMYVYNLRQFKNKEKFELIVEYIKGLTNGNHLVMIDGIRDLVSSPNDEDETRFFMETFLELTYNLPNVCIVSVLHQNPNGEKERGHLGTELINKCSSEWVVTANHAIEKDKSSEILNYSAKNIRCRKERSLSIMFTWKNGNVIPANIPMHYGNDNVLQQWNRVLDFLSCGNHMIKASELRAKIKATGITDSDRTATSIIQKFESRNFIEKSTKQGFYTYIKDNIQN